jgi:hypothetical protein
VNSVAVLLEAGRGATPSETAPVVLADAGVENVNAQVDELINLGVLRRLLAFTELKFSNSMIEAWWRCLTHHRLFLRSQDSVTTVRRLVAFYVDEHNRVLPHSAFRGQTPDEMYIGTPEGVPGRPDVTRGGRAPDTHGSQPIGVGRRGCVTMECLTAVPDHRDPTGPYVWRRSREKPGTARRTSRRAEPCPDHCRCPIKHRPPQ